MKSNNALIVILGTVTLDAVGIGLVMPVLPGLLRDYEIILWSLVGLARWQRLNVE